MYFLVLPSVQLVLSLVLEVQHVPVSPAEGISTVLKEVEHVSPLFV